MNTFANEVESAASKSVQMQKAEFGEVPSIAEIISIVNKYGVYIGKVPVGGWVKNDEINPRKDRNEKEYLSLKTSILDEGITQSICFRVPSEVESANFIEVVAGNTRSDIATEISLPWVPGTVRKMSVEEARRVAGSENIQRSQMSIIEEGEHASKLLVEHNNDMDVVLKILGWDLKKFKTRTALTYACPSVRTALVNKEITLGHLVQLVTIRKEAQETLLEIIKRDKLDVEQTKAKINARELALSAAKFDTKDCKDCQHNTGKVKELFSSVGDKDKCRNAVCWTEKTDGYLIAQMNVLREEYSVCKFEDEVTADSTVDLVVDGKNGVGTTQYGLCKSDCKDFGVVVSKKLNREGELRESVCFNLGCHAQKVRAAQENLIATDKQGQIKNKKADTENGKENKQNKNESDAAKQQRESGVSGISKGMKRYAFKVFCKAASKAAIEDDLMSDAVSLLMMYKSTKADSGKALDIIGVNDKAESVILDALFKADVVARKRFKESLIDSFLTHPDYEDNFETDRSNRNACKVLFLKNVDISVDWIVDSNYFNERTKAGIFDDLDRSGFANSFIEAVGEKEFSALKALKMDDIKKKISEFTGFDWKGYLPEALNFRGYFVKNRK